MPMEVLGHFICRAVSRVAGRVFDDRWLRVMKAAGQSNASDRAMGTDPFARVPNGT